MSGQGVVEDPSLAASWLSKAADSGDPHAICTLAELYATGRGVEQDTDRARSLYREATELGEPGGYRGLAEMHEIGLGTPVNLVVALKFAQLAVFAYHSKPETRDGLYEKVVDLGIDVSQEYVDKLEKEMSEEDIASARDLVKIELELRQLRDGQVPASWLNDQGGEAT